MYRSKNIKIMYFAIIFLISCAFYVIGYLTDNYDIDVSIILYFPLCIVYILFWSWLFRKWYLNKKDEITYSPNHNKISHLKSQAVFYVIFCTVNSSIMINQVLVYHYNLLFGTDVYHMAEVKDKQFRTVKGGQNGKYYGIYINSESFSKKELGNDILYSRVEKGMEIQIIERKSAIGSYIEYARITPIDNRNKYEFRKNQLAKSR